MGRGMGMSRGRGVNNARNRSTAGVRVCGTGIASFLVEVGTEIRTLDNHDALESRVYSVWGGNPTLGYLRIYEGNATMLCEG